MDLGRGAIRTGVFRALRCMAALRFTFMGLALFGITLSGCREITNFESTPITGSDHTIVWERTNGLSGEEVLSLRSDRNGRLYAGTADGKLFRTITDGDDWSPISLPVSDGGITAILVGPTGHLFIANDIHGIFESGDNGVSWFQLNGGLGDTAVYCLAYLPSGRLVAGTARGEISITGNSIPIWELKTNLARPVTSLLVLSNEEIYASAWAGGIFRFGETSPGVVQLNSGLQDLYVNALYSGGSGYLFAGTRNSGFFRSDAENPFWQNIGGNSISRDVTSFRLTQFGELFAGTGTGIFLSVDMGLHWIKLDGGIGNREVGTLSVNETATVFAGTADGVYRSIRVE